MFKNNGIRLVAALLACIMLLGVFAGCNKKDPVEDPVDTENPIKTGSAEDDPSEVIAFKSEHYTITNDMFAFYFYKDYYDAIDMYYESYFYYNNLDPTKDLKEQTYGDSGTTWFDYFITVTYQNIVNYLLFAEAAIADGVELNDEDYKYIDEEIAALESGAEYEGFSVQEFLDYRFGYGVTVDTVRECTELYLLGTKYFDDKIAEYVYDDEDFDKYYEEHKEDFLYIDFRKTEVRADQQTYANEEEKAKAYAAAKKTAETIAASKNLGEYVERSIAYYKSINDSLEEPLTDEEIRAQATNVTVQYSYRTTTSLGQWGFAEGRKDGDITVLDNGSGIYTVYYLQSAPYRAENLTKNMRMVSFSLANYENDEAKMKEKANELYAKWKELGGTGEALELAAEELEIYAGTLREEVDLGETQPVVEYWLFNGDRKPGDCEILEDENACYLIYFEGDGEISWKIVARDALVNEAVNEFYTSLAKRHNIDFNLDNMKLISGVTAYTATEE